jgi:hypothetical protein
MVCKMFSMSVILYTAEFQFADFQQHLEQYVMDEHQDKKKEPYDMSDWKHVHAPVCLFLSLKA